MSTMFASAPALPKVSNATIKKTNAFMVWKSQGNKFFETFSYLPPLSDAEVLKQVQYLINNKFNPCVEFEFPETAYAVPAFESGFDSRSSSGFYHNRYWSMWKLPMYGATDADLVLAECKKCAKAFPNAFVRLVGFSAERQVQMVSFLTARPATNSQLPVNQRQVPGN